MRMSGRVLGFSSQPKNNGLKTIAALFVISLLLFVSGASAESGVSSAGSSAGAAGDSVAVASNSYASGNMATASASARATSSDGRDATVWAAAYVDFLDYSSAEASSYAHALSRAGQTVYAAVNVYVSASYDGSAAGSDSRAGVGTGDSGNGGSGSNGGGSGSGGGGSGDNSGSGNGGNSGNSGNDNGDPGHAGAGTQKPVIIVTPVPDRGMFGFTFCTSDPCRYYYFKHVADNNSTLSLADSGVNVTGHGYQQARAKYYLDVILNDYGLNATRFEAKYPKENYNLSEISDTGDTK